MIDRTTNKTIEHQIERTAIRKNNRSINRTNDRYIERNKQTIDNDR